MTKETQHYHEDDKVILILIERIITELSISVTWSMNVAERLDAREDDLKHKIMEEAIKILWK